MYSDLINQKPQYNVATAIEVGIPTPEVQFLGNLSREKREEVLLSPDWEITDDGMAIQSVAGLEATFHAFWDGERFGCHVITVDDNRMFTGGQGPLLRSNISTMFYGHWAEMDRFFAGIVKILLNHEDFRGFISITVIFKDKKPYYRKILCGATPALAINLKRVYGEIVDLFRPEGLQRRTEPTDKIGAQCRVFGMPYTVEINHQVYEFLKDMPEAEFDGESYIMSAASDSIKQSWRSIYSQLSGLERYGICWRTDGDLLARRVYHELKYRQYI